MVRKLPILSAINGAIISEIAVTMLDIPNKIPRLVTGTWYLR